jgi:hypothetical protein
MSEALIPTLEAAIQATADALPRLGLTPFQEKYILTLLVYEQMQLAEGWVAEWITDMTVASAGLPEDDPGSP